MSTPFKEGSYTLTIKRVIEVLFGDNEEEYLSIIYVYMDKTGPSISVTPSCNLEGARNVNVTITARDDNTGLSSYSGEYWTNYHEKFISLGGTDYVDGTSFKYNEQITLGNATGTYYLWIKAPSDRAGNIAELANSDTYSKTETYNGETYFRFGPYVIDRIVPSYEVRYEDETEGKYSKTKKVDVYVTDNIEYIRRRSILHLDSIERCDTVARISMNLIRQLTEVEYFRIVLQSLGKENGI